MTVADNLRVGAENRIAAPGVVRLSVMLLGILGFQFSDVRRHGGRVDEVLDLLELGRVRDELAGTLPTGMLRLVELGRALCHDPTVLLLDEPASGLDQAELAELGRLIRELAAEGSLVVVEHHMDLMMSVCDSITVLDFGKVIASGTQREVQDDPAVTAAYLGADGPGER